MRYTLYSIFRNLRLRLESHVVICCLRNGDKFCDMQFCVQAQEFKFSVIGYKTYDIIYCLVIFKLYFNSRMNEFILKSIDVHKLWPFPIFMTIHEFPVKNFSCFRPRMKWPNFWSCILMWSHFSGAENLMWTELYSVWCMSNVVFYNSYSYNYTEWWIFDGFKLKLPIRLLDRRWRKSL